MSSVSDPSPAARAADSAPPAGLLQAYHYLFERNPDAMLIYDRASMQLLAVNDAALARYGHTRDELLQLNLLHLHPADEVSRLLELKSMHFAGDQHATLWRHKRKDGSAFTAEVRSHELEWSGRPARVACVVDVTEREAAAARHGEIETALRASEERLRLLMSQIPGALWMTDHELRFTLSQVTGPESAHLRTAPPGSTLFEYFQTTDAKFLPIASHRRALNGERVSYEMSWSGRTYQTHLEPLRNRHGDIDGVIGIALDVTERVRLEEQLRLAQKMEAVGRLAGGIAHDFNNVLTSISGHINLLLEDTAKQDPRRADLEEIGRAAKRAAALTGQLLAFGRKQIRQPRVLDIGAVFNEMQRMVRRLIGEDIALSINAAPDLGGVRADQNQLEQVLLNLIVNARDAMPNGGQLELDARNVALDAAATFGAPAGHYVALSVRDSGTGIEIDNMPHIFEPFFTTKPAGQGTGLGLATVYAIVQESGGYINVDSTVGEGTSFTILLPRVQRQATSAATPLDQSPQRGSERVLLVEDEDAVRALVRRVLQRNGYSVLDVASGPEAIAVLELNNGAFDIVVTDVVMPGLNGRELAEQVHKRWPAVQVLFTSGYTEDDVLRRGVFLAADEFLPKPFTPKQLCAKLRSVLDRKRVLSASKSN